MLATTGIVAGNHHDAFNLQGTLKKLFADLKRCHLAYKGAIFNADSGFDTRAARKMLWNDGVIPNSPENKRSRKARNVAERVTLITMSITNALRLNGPVPGLTNFVHY